MEQEHKNLKPLLLAAVAAVTVVAILLVFFFSGRKSASSQTIVLPEPPAPEQTESEQQPQTSLASVSRENVQSILQKSVSRPSSYHQSMQIVITSGDVQRTQTAELWVKGELVKAQITDELETKTVLADATTLYAWYDGEQEPVKLARGAGLSTDNLAGVPTYEAILSYAKSQLTQAAFVTLDEQASDCVYVSAQDGECQQDYWVSLDSGLLCKQTMTVSGELVYLMEQTALEIFPDNDEALEGIFCLPDGTEAFSTEALPLPRSVKSSACRLRPSP